MSLKEMFDNNCLLAYQISSDPNPLQVSPAQGDPSYATLTVVVSNNTTKPIYCKQIKFTILVGDLAQNLTESAEGILVATSPSDKWQITNNKDGSFTASPTKPDNNLITKDGIAFYIYHIQVNKQVGEFNIFIEENSSNDNTNFIVKNNEYTLGKFPYGFFMKNFAPSSPIVDNGDAVTLTWNGSDIAIYTILYNGNQIDVTNTRNYTSLPLNNITTFILKGTVQYLGETIENYLSTTVIVEKPDITATSLNVSKQSNLNGNTAIGTDSELASLFVQGNVGIGTGNPENADCWEKVLDILGINDAKLSIRTQHIDSRVLSHEIGWWQAPAGMIIGTNSVHPLSFGTSAISRMTIDKDGNIGIGTTSPSHKLEIVNGNVKAEGFIGNGSEITGLTTNQISDYLAKQQLVRCLVFDCNNNLQPQTRSVNLNFAPKMIFIIGSACFNISPTPIGYPLIGFWTSAQQTSNAICCISGFLNASDGNWRGFLGDDGYKESSIFESCYIDKNSKIGLNCQGDIKVDQDKVTITVTFSPSSDYSLPEASVSLSLICIG